MTKRPLLRSKTTERTCIVCGRKTSKQYLTRIVAIPGGKVKVDRARQHPGRGAYLCRDSASESNELRKATVEYALKRHLTDDAWAELQESFLSPTLQFDNDNIQDSKSYSGPTGAI